MSTENLEFVAERVLGEDDRINVGKLIKEGRIDEATKQLFEAIKGHRADEFITALEAMELTNLLVLPPEVVREFPQVRILA